MKTLDFQQMEMIEGGTACEAVAVIGTIAGIASMFGPVGLAIAGPTAVGMGVASIICAFKM